MERGLVVSIIISVIFLIASGLASAFIFLTLQVQVWGIMRETYYDPGFFVKSLFYIVPVVIGLIPVGIYLLYKRTNLINFPTFNIF